LIDVLCNIPFHMIMSGLITIPSLHLETINLLRTVKLLRFYKLASVDKKVSYLLSLNYEILCLLLQYVITFFYRCSS
jgi:hypothetical protein